MKMSKLIYAGFFTMLFFLHLAIAYGGRDKSDHDPVKIKVQDVITVTAKEFKFEPNEITVKKGQKVTLVFKNTGVITHNLAIDVLKLKTETIHAGETTELHFTADKQGEYIFKCAVPGHMQAGMTGKIIVE